jgi:hypothetical protein
MEEGLGLGRLLDPEKTGSYFNSCVPTQPGTINYRDKTLNGHFFSHKLADFKAERLVVLEDWIVDTPCTSILLAVERDIQCTSICWRWKLIHPARHRRLLLVLFLLYDVEKS